MLENRPVALVDEILRFCIDVGLPVTLADIGVTDATEEKIRRVAEVTAGPEETIHSEPFPVTADIVYAAIMAADALGTDAKRRYGVARRSLPEGGSL